MCLIPAFGDNNALRDVVEVIGACCENERNKPWLNNAEVVGIYRYDLPVIIKCHVYGDGEWTEQKTPRCL
jgi:hypothetical protein